MQAKEQWGVPIQNGPIFSQLLKHLPASLKGRRRNERLLRSNRVEVRQKSGSSYWHRHRDSSSDWSANASLRACGRQGLSREILQHEELLALRRVCAFPKAEFNQP